MTAPLPLVIPDGKNRKVVAQAYPTRAEHKWEPKRLTPKHRQILTLYAQGMKRHEIGSYCKCTPELVSMIATSIVGKLYLKEIEGHMDQRLRSLYCKSIDAIEDQLENGKGENKLKAAALQMRATGKLGRSTEDEETAEDVIARVMNLQVNVQVNAGSTPVHTHTQHTTEHTEEP